MMSDQQKLGKRRRRSKTKGNKKARVDEGLGGTQTGAPDGSVNVQTKRAGRPKGIREVKHHRTTAAETKHANTLKTIMQSMHEHYRSIREFLRAFFTNPQMESAHQNFFKGGGFEEILGLMLESKYMKNAPMPEVIATNVENYCVVCNLVNYSLGLMTETDVSDIERNGEFAG